MGIRTLGGKIVEGSIAASGTIDAANEIIGPVTIPGLAGDVALLTWAWSQTGGPSVVTLERSLDGGTTWVAFRKSDGSVGGKILYGTDDLVVKAGHQYRLKVPTADFVGGTAVTGSFL